MAGWANWFRLRKPLAPTQALGGAKGVRDVC